MAINEIIKQIDAYLALLHQARELLSSDGKRPSFPRSARPEREIRLNSKKPRIPAGQLEGETNSPLRRPGAGRVSSVKRAVRSFQSKAPLPSAPDLDPTIAANSDETNSPTVVVNKVLSQRRRGATRLVAHRHVKPFKQDSIKPATALGNVKGAKIIVISAEQARLERERLANPVTVRPRSPGSGSTGRLAFEALFGR
jgi:hypothetical protein